MEGRAGADLVLEEAQGDAGPVLEGGGQVQVRAGGGQVQVQAGGGQARVPAWGQEGEVPGDWVGAQSHRRRHGNGLHLLWTHARHRGSPAWPGHQ